MPPATSKDKALELGKPRRRVTYRPPQGLAAAWLVLQNQGMAATAQICWFPPGPSPKPMALHGPLRGGGASAWGVGTTLRGRGRWELCHLQGPGGSGSGVMLARNRRRMVEEAAASPVSGGGSYPARPVPALSAIPDGSPPFPCVSASPRAERATAGPDRTQSHRAPAPPLVSVLTLSGLRWR